MKTPYLDRQIDLLEIHERLQKLTDDGKDILIEYKAIKEQLNIHSVSKSLPTIIEIDFDGHLKCQIETTDKTPTILKAVNGYGQPVDCNKEKIRINEI